MLPMYDKIELKNAIKAKNVKSIAATFATREMEELAPLAAASITFLSSLQRSQMKPVKKSLLYATPTCFWEKRNTPTKFEVFFLWTSIVAVSLWWEREITLWKKTTSKVGFYTLYLFFKSPIWSTYKFSRVISIHCLNNQYREFVKRWNILYLLIAGRSCIVR